MHFNKDIRDKDFYYQDIPVSAVNDKILLNEDNTHHNVVVLRRKPGDHIVIIDGRGSAYLCRISAISKRSCEVIVEDRDFRDRRPYELLLGIGLTKNKSRNEWFLEKAVEIGIDGIITLDSEHAEPDRINTSRTSNILSAAMIQSKGFYLPELRYNLQPAETVNLFKEQYPEGHILIAHCEDGQKNHILQELKPSVSCLILIGPEGDFSKEEILYCLEAGATPVTLGPKRLRTETAAIYATTIFNAVNYE